jgi:MFS transporter, PPP family, 3-phenylpropionic acid transporter
MQFLQILFTNKDNLFLKFDYILYVQNIEQLGEIMEKLARQLTLRYAFLQITYWISQCCIYSFAAVYLQSKNFNNTQIGIVLALASVLSIVLQPAVAAFADKTKKISLRYIVVSLMLIVFILALFLLIMPESLTLIASIYILISAIQFTLNPLFNSLALEYLNLGIPMNYGLARGMGSIFFAITSSSLGYIVDLFGAGIIVTIFLVSYIFVILSAILFKITLPKSMINNANSSAAFNIKKGDKKAGTIESSEEKIDHSSIGLSDDGKRSIDKSPSVSEDSTETTNTSGIFHFFVKYKKFSFLLIGIAMLFYSHSLINTYLINIMEHVGGNSKDMGISLGIAAAVELPTMGLFIYIIRKFKCNKLMIISAFFFLVKIIITWAAPNVLTVHISQVFQMFCYALYTPASVYYVNSIVDDNDKVKGQSMLGVASMGIAGTVANITGGKILDTVGVSNMLLIGTIVTAIGFVIVCFSTENTDAAIKEAEIIDIDSSNTSSEVKAH